jgi:hypothetical protein
MGDGGVSEWLAKINYQTWLWLIIIIGSIILAFYVSSKPHYPLSPVFNAPPYIWPKSCPKLNYAFAASRGDDLIACECADEEYRIYDWVKRGLMKSGKGGNAYFYRIEDNAVQISIISHGKDGEKCRISHLQAGFFSQDNKTSYQHAVDEAAQGMFENTNSQKSVSGMKENNK